MMTTTEPGSSGATRLALAKLKAWRTSMCQLVLNVSQVCWKGARYRSGSGIEHHDLGSVLGN